MSKYVLVIIGLDPTNRLVDAKGTPLGDPLISSTDGSHGCSHCDTGKVAKRTDKGFDLVPTLAAELFVPVFENEEKAQEWLQTHKDALTGKLICGFVSNYGGPPASEEAFTTEEEALP
jgi:hypothetical protein